MISCSLGVSSHSIYLIYASINTRIWTRLYLNHSYTKRLLSTIMTSSNEQSSETETSEKQDNLLAKRFVGLEKNIW